MREKGRSTQYNEEEFLLPQIKLTRQIAQAADKNELIDRAIEEHWQHKTDGEIAEYLRAEYGIEVAGCTIARHRQALGLQKSVGGARKKVCLNFTGQGLGAVIREGIERRLDDQAILRKCHESGFMLTLETVVEYRSKLERIDAIILEAAARNQTDAQTVRQIEIEAGIQLSERTIIRIRQAMQLRKQRGGVREHSGRKTSGMPSAKGKKTGCRRIAIGDTDFIRWCSSGYTARASVWDPFQGKWLRKEKWVAAPGYQGTGLRSITIEPGPPRIKYHSTGQAWEALQGGAK